MSDAPAVKVNADPSAMLLLPMGSRTGASLTGLTVTLTSAPETVHRLSRSPFVVPSSHTTYVNVSAPW